MITQSQIAMISPALAKLAWHELLPLAKENESVQFKALLTQLIVQLDQTISEQLSEVMQHNDFKQL